MSLPRVIPCLLLRNKGLVKGVQFKNHKYVGDPINAVQIFNNKEVDEILFLDIGATDEKRIPSLDLIQKIADHCWTPFAVGGGIKSLEDARKILAAGAEKVCIGTAAAQNPQLVREIADSFGSQSVVVSVDYKKNWLGRYEYFSHCGQKCAGKDIFDYLDRLQSFGVGEVLLNSIQRDGTRQGYDLEFIKLAKQRLDVPIIAQGGAGSVTDVVQVIRETEISAASAGSIFVFHGKLDAVLISYPDPKDLTEIRGEL